MQKPIIWTRVHEQTTDKIGKNSALYSENTKLISTPCNAKHGKNKSLILEID